MFLWIVRSHFCLNPHELVSWIPSKSHQTIPKKNHKIRLKKLLSHQNQINKIKKRFNTPWKKSNTIIPSIFKPSKPPHFGVTTGSPWSCTMAWIRPARITEWVTKSGALEKIWRIYDGLIMLNNGRSTIIIWALLRLMMIDDVWLWMIMDN